MTKRPAKQPFASKLGRVHNLVTDVLVLRVIIIRHGEKPMVGNNLACAGLNRSLALPTVLNELLPAPPEYTYVPLIGTNSRATSTARMFQTITPCAVQHNLLVNSEHDVTATDDLAADLRRKRGTALVVWEHHHIPGTAKKLGLKEQLVWPEDDFDSIWIVDFGKESKKGKAKQPTLTRTQQGLEPSSTCPTQ